MAIRKRRAAKAKVPRPRRARAGTARVLAGLSSDWYWEQDASLRFTRVEVNSDAASEKTLADLLIGRRRWDTGIDTEGGWDAHRALLKARKPFRDLLAWRAFPDGSRRYVSVSGEPMLDARGRFAGYRGIGRDVTEQKRAEQLLRLEHTVTKWLAEAAIGPGALQAPLRAICGTENWDCGAFWKLDGAAGVIRQSEYYSVPDVPAARELVEARRDLAITPGQGLVGRVWQTRKPLWIPDLTNDVRVVRKAIAGKTGLLSALLVPVMSGGEIVGVLDFNCRQIRPPDERLLQALNVVAAQIGQFLQRAQAEQAVRESEARFRSLTELSSDWYWEQDQDFRFTRLAGQGAASNARGGDPSIYIGKARWEIADLAPLDGDWSAHRRQLERHESFRDLLLQRRMSESVTRYMAISGEPVFAADGRLAGYRGLGRDITAQKRAEQLRALEHSVTRLFAEMPRAADALQAAMGAICESERWQCARYLRVDSAAGLLRFGADWSVSDPAVESYIQVSRSVVYAPGVGLVGKVWQSQQPLWVVDITNDPRVARPGLARDAGMRGAFVVPVAAEGRPIGVLIFHSRQIRERDDQLIETLRVIGGQIGQFVERAQAEQAMRESEARFRALTELSSDWYWEQDSEFRITLMSKRFAERTGMDAAIYLGRRRWDEPALNLSEADWERHRRQLERHEPFRDFEIQRAAGGGKTAWLSLSGEPVLDETGRFLGYRGVGRDITAQRRDEQLLRLEHHVALSLSEAADSATGLRAVLRAFCEAEGWSCGRFFAVDEAAGVLRVTEAWCVPEPALLDFVERSRSFAFRPGEGLAGLAWRSAEPIWSSDTRSDPRVHPARLQDDTNIRGAFVFTATAAGKVFGVLSFTSQSVREPDERLRQAARVIGTQIGQFLQRRQAEEAVRESEARFRSLTQMSSDFFWETDTQHRFAQMVHGPNYVSKFGRVLLGKTAWELPSLAPDEAGWATLRASFEAHESFRDFEFARPWPDGGTRYFTVSGEPRFASDGSFLGYRGVGRETTEVALAREHIASLAYSDALTGLANRTSLGPAFDQAVERARRRTSKLAAMFIDLDGFKPINDAYGHSAGDRLLVEVARRLRANLRASDIVARLGGDEFFIVLEDVHDRAVLETVARKILAEIAHPYEVGATEQPRLTASMGISIYPEDAGDSSALMKHADMAMYAAKQAGKNTLRFYIAGETSGRLARSNVS